MWWPWACQLLVVDASTTYVEFDLVSLEPRRITGTIVDLGVEAPIEPVTAAPLRERPPVRATCLTTKE